VASSRSQGSDGFADWRRTNRAVLALGVVFGGGTLVLGYAGDAAIPGLSSNVLAWMAALVVLLPLIRLRSAALRGLRHTVLAQIPLQVIRPFAIIVLLALSTLSGLIVLDANNAALINTAATALALITVSAFLTRCRPDIGPRSSLHSAYPLRMWLLAAAPFAGVQAIEQINLWADRLVLGTLGAASQLGIYTVAAQGALLTRAGIMVLNLVIAPYLARLHAEGDSRRLEHLTRLVAMGTAALGVAMLAGLYIAGGPLLQMLFGSAYSEAYWPMLALSASQVVTAACGPAALTLNMCGRERDTLAAMATASITNILLSVMLLPEFGILGVAIATLFGFLVLNTWLVLAVRRTLGINPTLIGPSLS